MPTELDYSIADSMAISPVKRAEKKLVDSNPRYSISICPMKPGIAGSCSTPQDFMTGVEQATQYMGADSTAVGKAETKRYPYEYPAIVKGIVGKYGRVYSWGSATQLPAIRAAEWFRDQGHDVFVLWKPELWHINQSRRERWGRGMDDYGYDYPPEPASDTWEVLVSYKETDRPKIRIYQPYGDRTEVFVFESRYPEEYLGGNMYGAPKQYYTRAGQGNWNRSLARVTGPRPKFAAPQGAKKPGFFSWLKSKFVRMKAPQPYYTRAGQGNWNTTLANVTSPRPSFASPQPYYGRATRGVRMPDGMEVKFATTEVHGVVVPRPRVLPPVYAHQAAPIKWVRMAHFAPKGTLESMESVFR